MQNSKSQKCQSIPFDDLEDRIWRLNLRTLLKSLKAKKQGFYFLQTLRAKQKETKNSFLLNGYTVSEKADFACFSHWKSELDNKINL